ncbi:MAG TPA: S-layer protein [archaeon]|nr:S-layer protein [archaeon]
MKGLNVKKLAAIAVGTALVGSAIAPMVAATILNNADQLTKADLVNTTTGAPLVQVAVGTSGAAVSDFVWAGNIAAKVAQLATTNQQVAVTQGSGTNDPTVSAKTVDVTVGGSTTYSSTLSYSMKDTNYPMNSTSNAQAAHEFVKELGSGQLQSILTNTTKTYTYNGSTTSLQVKEEFHIDADAKFDKLQDVKDLALIISANGFKYVASFGGATNNGIPAIDSSSDAVFDDGDNDNMVIPFLGETYTVNQIDSTASPKTLRLIKESAKTKYYEGNEITGLTGKGAYAGQELKVKVAAITAAGTAVASYSAQVDLYDSEGNLLDTQSVSAGAFLDEIFLSGGTYVLDSTVYVSTISVEVSTGKGYVTATVGKGVVRIADAKQFPYDSSDTNSMNDYWIAGLDFNSTASSAPGYYTTLQKITIKNSEKRWDGTGVKQPLFAGDQSLIEAHKTASQEAIFMDSINATIDTLGYDFIRLKFDGFEQNKTIATYKIGKLDGCSAGLASNSGCVQYKDSGSALRDIPFYIEFDSDLGSTSWSSFTLSSATFWYRCSQTDTNVVSGGPGIATADANSLYLNGFKLDINGGVAADINLMTDFGYRFNAGAPVDLNGVTYVVTGNTPGNIGLYTDGNCQFSSTDPTGSITNATWIGGGGGTPVNNTIYYNDENGARIGKASAPLTLSASLLNDTYKYAFTANEEQGKGYLLLDRTTNFTSPYANFDVFFQGTDLEEQGSLVLSAGPTIGFNDAAVADTERAYFRKHYVPDILGMGGNEGDLKFYVAQFAMDANGGTSQDFNINIQTSLGKPVPYPNTNLLIYTADVNAPTTAWSYLTTDATALSYLQHAYLDYGTKIDVTSDYVTVTGPETQTYLKLTALGKGATTTVSGGEALTGLAVDQTGKTSSGTEVTVTAINVTATCPAGGGAVPLPATYKSIYPVGQLVTTDTVAPGKAIIVGGYLVNKLAQNVVLSDGTNLTEALTASGDRVVDVLSDGSVIVAGYTAADTTQAAQDLIEVLDTLLE